MESGKATEERITPADLAELDWESRRAPMNIVAILRTRHDMDPDEVRRTLAERVCTIPRLRQVVRLPRRRSHAVWTPDTNFAIEHHLSVVSCPRPGDDNALFELAAAEAGTALPRERPLWRAVQVTGLRDGGGALVLVLHHAVADGAGALAILSRLADERTGAPPVLGDQPQLGQGDTAVPDAGGFTAGVPVARHARPRRGRGRSLNQPIGAERGVAVTTTALAPLVFAAHRASATVNDLLMVAVAEALRAVLAAEGQDVRALVVSVPVAQRSVTTPEHLGNRVGVMPVRVPCEGPLSSRVAEVAAITRRRRPAARRANRLGPSRVLTGPVFRLLTRLGVFQWFIDHQRLVDTFVTNVHGPEQPLTLIGTPVVGLTPFSPIAGNVTVAFTVFSYAGTLSVSVVVDADRWPDTTPITSALSRALTELGQPRDPTTTVQSQPRSLASRAAAVRLAAPSLRMASDR